MHHAFENACSIASMIESNDNIEVITMMIITDRFVTVFMKL